jgi:hypothetical protein
MYIHPNTWTVDNRQSENPRFLAWCILHNSEVTPPSQAGLSRGKLLEYVRETLTL